jgi:hypothetical protein
MIRTANHFAVDKHIGQVFSISVSQPKGLPPKIEAHVLFPRWRIVSDLKDGTISWAEYKELYLADLRDRERAIVDFFSALEGDATICCWEEEPQACHRSLAAEFLREKGFEVEVL